ncbi:hypothetical protein Misp02_06100 [Microtetraspora sp. NBRC 16547]|nr:hypothetical protein Misp02_06100 [Microtetraspora sp. NBRC 16547]
MSEGTPAGHGRVSVVADRVSAVAARPEACAAAGLPMRVVTIAAMSAVTAALRQPRNRPLRLAHPDMPTRTYREKP